MSDRTLIKALIVLNIIGIGLLAYIAHESYLIFWNY
jgi:hypothetical protein